MSEEGRFAQIHQSVLCVHPAAMDSRRLAARVTRSGLLPSEVQHWCRCELEQWPSSASGQVRRDQLRDSNSIDAHPRLSVQGGLEVPMFRVKLTRTSLPASMRTSENVAVSKPHKYAVTLYRPVL